MAASSEAYGLKRALLALALAALVVASARADILLDSVSWQMGKANGVHPVTWEDTSKLVDGPPRLDARLRARLTLKNRGPKAAEGILLRYSMTARIQPASGDKPEGVWAIPFMVDEKRVPKVGPNNLLEVFLTTSPSLELYLNKLSRAGWWPDRVKIQVMVEPHRGATEILSLENVLEVAR